MKKSLFAQFVRLSNARQRRFVLMLVMLMLFVLGAGAPESAGGPGG